MVIFMINNVIDSLKRLEWKWANMTIVNRHDLELNCWFKKSFLPTNKELAWLELRGHNEFPYNVLRQFQSNHRWSGNYKLHFNYCLLLREHNKVMFKYVKTIPNKLLIAISSPPLLFFIIKIKIHFSNFKFLSLYNLYPFWLKQSCIKMDLSRLQGHQL